MPSSPQHLPAERVRHRKRAPLPLEPRDEEEYTSSAVPFTTITITKEESSTAPSATSLSTTATTTRSSTTSSLSSTASPSSSSSSSSSVSSVAESTSAGSSQSSTTPPLPSASAIVSTPASAPDAQQNGAVSKQTLPAGAIAGIVIAVVLVLVAVALILLRNRFMQRRRSRVSTWISRPRLASAFDPASDTYNDAPQSSGMQFNQSGAMATPLTMPSASWNNAGISSGTIPPPSSAIVKSRFIPSLPDELPISNGETVRILQEFDDGWALCANGREEQGMVPLECLERLTPTSGLPATASDLRKSARESSLYGLNPVRR
ncbi:hypothetical protein ARMSODRAFT_947705 [Armillaria solidipes]|uniref:SH3 domain-containing protein n=1 Tax=Armillaria solidipes TaxID=1076256 RepID=A0A2H3CRH3_9AGAR|nr:hypothetical protein ARMSODRAFT_947705 [Armillaria solidipes]